MAFLQPGIMTDSPRPSKPAATSFAESSFFSQRARRQLGLFCAGAGFFAITSLITRRSIVRRYKATVPKFYHPSNKSNFEVNGALEAFEALNIATINVMSVGMMATGGLLYAFDISSLDDMRQKVRKQIGVEGIRTDQDVEEEIEEWFATVLERKDLKEQFKKKAKEIKETREVKVKEDKS